METNKIITVKLVYNNILKSISGRHEGKDVYFRVDIDTPQKPNVGDVWSAKTLNETDTFIVAKLMHFLYSDTPTKDYLLSILEQTLTLYVNVVQDKQIKVYTIKNNQLRDITYSISQVLNLEYINDCMILENSSSAFSFHYALNRILYHTEYKLSLVML